MNEEKKLSIEGIISSGSDLNNASAQLNEVCTEMYKYITSLRESETFKTVVASSEYFANIDELNAIVPKYSEAILRFSKFLAEYVVQNYTETDEETKAKIEANLASSIEQLQSLGAINSQGLDYTKIANTASNANQGNFISEDKILKQYFEDGELEYITREDGSLQIVKNGTTMGFTTADGIVSAPKVEASSNTTVAKTGLTREQMQKELADLAEQNVADLSERSALSQQQIPGIANNVDVQKSMLNQPKDAAVAMSAGISALNPSGKAEVATDTANIVGAGLKYLDPSISTQIQASGSVNAASKGAQSLGQPQVTGAFNAAGNGVNAIKQPSFSQNETINIGDTSSITSQVQIPSQPSGNSGVTITQEPGSLPALQLNPVTDSPKLPNLSISGTSTNVGTNTTSASISIPNSVSSGNSGATSTQSSWLFSDLNVSGVNTSTAGAGISTMNPIPSGNSGVAITQTPGSLPTLQSTVVSPLPSLNNSGNGIGNQTSSLPTIDGPTLQPVFSASLNDKILNTPAQTAVGTGIGSVTGDNLSATAGNMVQNIIDSIDQQ